MHDVFISYSTLDTDIALNIRNTLEIDGVRCWMAPRDIPGGSNYTREIPVAIRNSQIFLLVLTKNAQASQWVLKELDAAVNERRFILPVMADSEPLRDEFTFLLSGAQRHPASPPDFTALKALSARVQSILLPKTTENAGKSLSEEPVSRLIQRKAVLCPGCQWGDGLEERKGIHRATFEEKMTLVLIPLFGAACFFLTAVITATIVTLANITLSMFFLDFLELPVLIASFILGCWLGNKAGKEYIRRKRVRLHMDIHSYRCKKCAKKFHVDLNRL